MAEPQIAFAESVPQDYDRYLGPMFFEPYAIDLVNRLQVRGGMRVLEVACGTGVVTRKLRERIPPDGKLVATDLSEAMLARARQNFPAHAAIDWAQADGTALPFADSSFDAVVCQFGVMFMPDKLAAFGEARRVLATGGQFLFNVWESLAQNEFADVAHRTALAMFPDDPPRFYETPFGFYDTAVLDQLLRDAGFSEHAIRSVDLPCVSPSAADAARGAVLGTPLLIGIRERNGDVDAFVSAVTEELARRFGREPARGRMRALVGVATR